MILVYRCGCGHEIELEVSPGDWRINQPRRCPECLEWDARPVIGGDFK